MTFVDLDNKPILDYSSLQYKFIDAYSMDLDVLTHKLFMVGGRKRYTQTDFDSIKEFAKIAQLNPDYELWYFCDCSPFAGRFGYVILQGTIAIKQYTIGIG